MYNIDNPLADFNSYSIHENYLRGAIMSIKLGRYVHFKGKEYEVIGVASHSETLEEMVVYRALYGDGGIWVRPATMWNDVVEHDGRIVKRFTHEDELQ